MNSDMFWMNSGFLGMAKTLRLVYLGGSRDSRPSTPIIRLEGEMDDEGLPKLDLWPPWCLERLLF